MTQTLVQFEAFLQTTYQIKFNNVQLLQEATTQRNYLNEHPEETGNDYQRLEFLGDAVMQLQTTEYLYKHYPDWHEGQMTELRIALVQSKSFAYFARMLHLDQVIRIGKGEEQAGGRNRDSLLEDIFESFIGALYLDQGDQAVKNILQQTIFNALETTDFFEQFIDYKSKLQELLQQNGSVKVVYHVLSENSLPDNQQEFKAMVTVDGKKLAEGVGYSIKAAEKKAAQIAYQALKK